MSVMVNAPVMVPVVVGWKVTRMVQEAPAATLEPQVLVSEKTPVIVMLLMLSVALPVFVSVTDWGLLVVNGFCEAKVKEVGERLTAGPAPIPARLTVCVVGLALSVMVKVPVVSPVPVGSKVTLMMQEEPAATLEPQLLVWEN